MEVVVLAEAEVAQADGKTSDLSSNPSHKFILGGLNDCFVISHFLYLRLQSFSPPFLYPILLTCAYYPNPYKTPTLHHDDLFIQVSNLVKADGIIVQVKCNQACLNC